MAGTILICALALAAALPATAAAPKARRAWSLSVRSPGQLDLTVARVRFALPPGTRRPGLRIALAGPNGLDFVAAAKLRRQPPHALVALVVVSNRRPRGSLAPDLAAVRLGARVGRALRRPTLVQDVSVYGRPARAPGGLCATPAKGALRASGLTLLLSAGSPPRGFTATDSVAQAFDAACGRPANPAFRGAVDPPPGPQPQPQPPGCNPCPPCPSYPCPASMRIACPAPEPGTICPQA
jgi:hypothetical protein